MLLYTLKAKFTDLALHYTAATSSGGNTPPVNTVSAAKFPSVTQEQLYLLPELQRYELLIQHVLQLPCQIPVPPGNVLWLPQLSTRLTAPLSPAPFSLPAHVVEQML